MAYKTAAQQRAKAWWPRKNKAGKLRTLPSCGGTPGLRQEAQRLVPARQPLVGAGGEADRAAAAHEERVVPQPHGVPQHVVGSLPGEGVPHAGAVGGTGTR